MSGGRPPGGNGHLPPHQGHSPSTPNSVENASMVGGGRGPRGDHYAPPGGRYRRENEDQQRRIPRLRNRHRTTDQPPPPPPPPPPPSSSSSSSSSSQSQSQQPTQDKSQLPPVSDVCEEGGRSWGVSVHIMCEFYRALLLSFSVSKLDRSRSWIWPLQTSPPFQRLQTMAQLPLCLPLPPRTTLKKVSQTWQTL